MVGSIFVTPSFLRRDVKNRTSNENQATWKEQQRRAAILSRKRTRSELRLSQTWSFKSTLPVELVNLIQHKGNSVFYLESVQIDVSCVSEQSLKILCVEKFLKFVSRNIFSTFLCYSSLNNIYFHYFSCITFSNSVLQVIILIY